MCGLCGKSGCGECGRKVVRRAARAEEAGQRRKYVFFLGGESGPGAGMAGRSSAAGGDMVSTRGGELEVGGAGGAGGAVI